jgi:hypothetical protein
MWTVDGIEAMALAPLTMERLTAVRLSWAAVATTLPTAMFPPVVGEGEIENEEMSGGTTVKAAATC